MFVGSEGDDDELFIVDLDAAPLTAQRVNASHPGADVTFGYQHSADGRAIAYATAVPQGPQPIYLVDQDGDGLGVAVEVAADSGSVRSRCASSPDPCDRPRLLSPTLVESLVPRRLDHDAPDVA